MSDVTSQHTHNESTMDEGTPGEPHHWRILYIRWSDGATPADGDPQGVAVEDVLDVLLDRINQINDAGYPHDAVDVLRQMLTADKYGGPEAQDEEQAHDELQAVQDAHPDIEQEYPTGDELAAQGLDGPRGADQYHTYDPERELNAPAPWTSPGT